MKVAVINFYGNVGKTTIARHLLAPRIDGAELIAVESINADEGQGHALRGKQFGELQEYLQTVDNVVVDIGASNVEDPITSSSRCPSQRERSSRTKSRRPCVSLPSPCARLFEPVQQVF